MWITAVATIAIFVIGMASAESQHSSDRVDFYNTTVSSRVINGGQIQRNQLPWHVIVNIRRGRGYLAGGSLISSEFVLTEANSLRGADKFDCILGAHYSTDRKIVRQSTTAIIHPGHRQGNGNFNIALLKLDRAFTDFTRQIRPVLLPKALAFDDEFPYEGRHAWISGFGSTSTYTQSGLSRLSRNSNHLILWEFIILFHFHSRQPIHHQSMVDSAHIAERDMLWNVPGCCEQCSLHRWPRWLPFWTGSRRWRRTLGGLREGKIRPNRCICILVVHGFRTTSRLHQHSRSSYSCMD